MITINTIAEWSSFLKKWSEEWLKTEESFSSSVRKNKWLGYKPATEKQIEILEKRLGYRLPPSFRTFLLTSNGWRRTSSFILRIRPISKIEWLEVEDPGFLDVWNQLEEEGFGKHGGLSQEEYFSYIPASAEAFDKDHFNTSLVISDPVEGDSATYLLNPMVVTLDGEWEAWFSAHWIPGVRRYPSFFHLIEAEYQSFRQLILKDKERKEIKGPFEGIYAPDQPRCAAERIGPGKSRPRRLTIEELIEQLNDKSPKIRKKAAQKLFRQFKPHDPNDERPLLVKPLAQILHSNVEMEVRGAAACMLGSYGNKDAIESLVSALKDPEVAPYALSAIHYLSLYYQSPLIADGLCALLSETKFDPFTWTAIHILEDYREPRLESIALRILNSDNDKQLYFTAAFALAHISKQAIDELIPRLNHANPVIREVAAAALRETKDRRCIPALKHALKDESPEVRMQAETSLRMLQN